MLPALFLALLAVPIALQWSVQQSAARKGPKPLDIGVIFCWVVFMYGGLPVLGFMLAGWGIGSIQEARLGSDLPGDDRVLGVGLMYLLFSAGFAAMYGRLRRRARRAHQPAMLARASLRDVAIAVGLFVATKAMMLAMRAALGIQSEDDYLASYTELSGQPLIVQQLAGILGATELAVATLVIVTVIARNPRWHVYVAAFVVLQIVATLALGGSRTHAFACALAYIVARTLYDRRLRFGWVVAMAAAGLAMFLLAGALRQVRVDTDDVTGLYLLQGGEFVSVFVNALDLQDRLADLENPVLRLGMYLVDILRFIPRQFIGDFKVDPATFYVTTFYPEAAEGGAGLAFGAIAESVIGVGPVEALVRGLLLGLLYGLVRNACLKRRVTVVRAFIYTWFVVLAYQGIRDTTFSVFPRFFFQVAPILLILWALGALGLRSRRRRRRVRAAGPATTMLPSDPALNQR